MDPEPLVFPPVLGFLGYRTALVFPWALGCLTDPVFRQDQLVLLDLWVLPCLECPVCQLVRQDPKLRQVLWLLAPLMDQGYLGDLLVLEDQEFRSLQAVLGFLVDQ